MCTGEGQSSLAVSQPLGTGYSEPQDRTPSLNLSALRFSGTESSSRALTDALTDVCYSSFLSPHPSPLLFPACCRDDSLQGAGTLEQGWHVQLAASASNSILQSILLLVFCQLSREAAQKPATQITAGLHLKHGKDMGSSWRCLFVRVPAEGALAALLPASR